MTEFVDSFGVYALAIIGTPGSFAPSQISLRTRWNGVGTGNPQTSVVGGLGYRGNPVLYMPWGSSICRTLSHQVKYTVGFRLNWTSTLGGDLVYLCNCQTILATLKVNTDRSLLLYAENDVSKVIVSTAIASIPLTADCYVEFTVIISGSAPMNIAGQVWVDNASLGTGNVNLAMNQNILRSINFNQIFLLSGMNTNGVSYIYDLYLNNGSGATNTGRAGGGAAPYGVIIDPLVTIADGATIQWIPLAAPNWSQVNELPANDDTSYNHTTPPNFVDSYQFQPIPAFTGIIKSVQLSLSARSDAEGLRTFKGNIGPLGAEALTEEFFLCSDYFYRCRAFDLDPATGLVWTQAGFNAKKFGITLVQ